jgi:hypothetical protein
MEQLTAQQAKQVIEYFAQQTAEDLPTGSAVERDKHMWRALLTVSLAINRRVTELDWDVLVAAQIDFQSYDRDPEGWMNEHGYKDFGYYRHGEALADAVSFAIDNCYNNSGA